MGKKSKIPELAGTLVLACACAFSLAACAPQDRSDSENGTAQGALLNPNQIAIESTDYAAFDPNAQAENTSGTAIEGSDEEELQQERIAGGAVGKVTSTNIEPLNGIVDGSPYEYVPMYGTETGAKEVAHGSANGTECLTCHESGNGSATPMPRGHMQQNLESSECVLCHSID